MGSCLDCQAQGAQGALNDAHQASCVTQILAAISEDEDASMESSPADWGPTSGREEGCVCLACFASAVAILVEVNLRMFCFGLAHSTTDHSFVFAKVLKPQARLTRSLR